MSYFSFNSSTSASNQARSPHHKSINHKLMPHNMDAVPDQPSTDLRRRIKHFVFHDIDINWRALPTLYDDGYMLHVLQRMTHLRRCQSGQEYLNTILVVFRMQEPLTAPSLTSELDTVMVDDEEMVDLIG
jgi:hypothetical protein